MARKFFYVCAGLLCLAIAWHLGARNAGAQVEGQSRAGRYAIVAGGPEGFGGAMLLDTATGDTWGWDKLEMKDKSGAVIQYVEYWSERGPRGADAAIRVMRDLEEQGIRPTR